MVAASNSIEDKAEPYLTRIETLIAAGESAKGEYMAECKNRREDIKEILIEAKDKAGLSVKALKGIIKQRSLQKKIDEIPAGFDIDDQSQFEELAIAFGDTPMGQYAKGRASGAADDDDRDLRGNQQRQTERERADDAANLAKVGRGNGDAVDSLAKPN